MRLVPPPVPARPLAHSHLSPRGARRNSTFGQPHFRRPLLAREGWTLAYEELGEGFAYYWFTMQRTGVVRAEGPATGEKGKEEP